MLQQRGRIQVSRPGSSSFQSLLFPDFSLQCHLPPFPFSLFWTTFNLSFYFTLSCDLPADDFYDDIVDPKAKEKCWKDEDTRKTSNEDEQNEISQGDQEHPGPDEQKHCREIGVWV